MEALERDGGAALAAGRELLRGARGVVILTGAGLGADSGLATFREPGGHWRQYRPEDLATPAAFRRDPRMVWEWYETRRRAAAESVPNPAHLAMAEFALSRDDVVIATQNVDGLHTEAARQVATGDPRGALPLELHGCFFRLRCTGCGRRVERRAPIDASALETLPRCGTCDALQRPDVVWFGEPLGDVIDRVLSRASAAQVCLVVGTSAVVQPAASVALVTRNAGGAIIEVNPEETPLTPLSEVSLRTSAAEAVPALLARG